ncbi:MAG TPA: YheC/YheD family protein, partial [Bacillales bacterium]|nr:YheC/YheD family protein [Bacillales bacterium]
AAKVAGNGSVTTHIKYGGEVKTIEEVLGAEGKANLAREQLIRAALAISVVLEEKTEGIIGEIGFDLGIDRNGKVWLFEANSKPGRHIFIHPKLKTADERSRRLPLAFAVHLAEKRMNAPAMVYA